MVRYLIGLSNGWKVEHRRLRLWLSGVGCGALGAEHDEVLRGDQITGSEELGIDEQRCGSTRAERSGLLWSRRGFFSSGLTLMGRATFYMQTRWAKTHPVGQIDHPLQAIRPNWLIDCFLNFGKMILRKSIKIAATRLSYFKAEMHQIRFRLRIRPRPRWWSLQRSPRPLAGFKGPGAYLYISVYISASHMSLCQVVVLRYNTSTFGRRAFSVAGPTVWNSLPDKLRDPSLSIDSFRRQLKTFLFAD